IVTTNMNGDIMSDLTSALIGGLGFAPSANLGSDIAIFEAVHGSAPKYAGKNVINPTAVLMSGIMMLRYLGEFEAASKIEHAVLVTLEEGKVRTGDVVGYDSGKNCTTTQYTEAVIANLGKTSSKWKVREHKPIKMPDISKEPAYVKVKNRRVAGVDVFVEANLFPEEVGKKVEQAVAGSPFKLKMCSSRGTKVYPPTGTVIDVNDQYRCRIMLADPTGSASDDQIMDLLKRFSGVGLLWGHLEKLHELDGQPGWTKAQGED
ncbi:MAG TPA: isocitrate/isopropylmalate family dehydrogenase, partial [Gemmatales bacterium]|nr:isocitrate/isopropylmalate family dehydrogenase [Gemmatales bacterium]